MAYWPETNTTKIKAGAVECAPPLSPVHTPAEPHHVLGKKKNWSWLLSTQQLLEYTNHTDCSTVIQTDNYFFSAFTLWSCDVLPHLIITFNSQSFARGTYTPGTEENREAWIYISSSWLGNILNESYFTIPPQELLIIPVSLCVNVQSRVQSSEWRGKKLSLAFISISCSQQNFTSFPYVHSCVGVCNKTDILYIANLTTTRDAR